MLNGRPIPCPSFPRSAMRASSRLLVLASALLLTACASNAGPGRVRGNQNVISAEEIAASGALTALQLVQSLRPEWLRTRGIQSLSESTHTIGREGNNAAPVSNGDSRITIPNAGRPQILVYLGQARLGDTSSLEQVMAVDVASIQFLGPQQATLRYGSDHTHGAIVITAR
jgi:hypothetical protein